MVCENERTTLLKPGLSEFLYPLHGVLPYPQLRPKKCLRQAGSDFEITSAISLNHFIFLPGKTLRFNSLRQRACARRPAEIPAATLGRTKVWLLRHTGSRARILVLGISHHTISAGGAIAHVTATGEDTRSNNGESQGLEDRFKFGFHNLSFYFLLGSCFMPPPIRSISWIEDIRHGD